MASPSSASATVNINSTLGSVFSLGKYVIIVPDSLEDFVDAGSYSHAELIAMAEWWLGWNNPENMVFVKHSDILSAITASGSPTTALYASGNTGGSSTVYYNTPACRSFLQVLKAFGPEAVSSNLHFRIATDSTFSLMDEGEAANLIVPNTLSGQQYLITQRTGVSPVTQVSRTMTAIPQWGQLLSTRRVDGNTFAVNWNITFNVTGESYTKAEMYANYMFFLGKAFPSGLPSGPPGKGPYPVDDQTFCNNLPKWFTPALAYDKQESAYIAGSFSMETVPSVDVRNKFLLLVIHPIKLVKYAEEMMTSSVTDILRKILADHGIEAAPDLSGVEVACYAPYVMGSCGTGGEQLVPGTAGPKTSIFAYVNSFASQTTYIAALSNAPPPTTQCAEMYGEIEGSYFSAPLYQPAMSNVRLGIAGDVFPPPSMSGWPDSGTFHLVDDYFVIRCMNGSYFQYNSPFSNAATVAPGVFRASAMLEKKLLPYFQDKVFSGSPYAPVKWPVSYCFDNDILSVTASLNVGLMNEKGSRIRSVGLAWSSEVDTPTEFFQSSRKIVVIPAPPVGARWVVKQDGYRFPLYCQRRVPILNADAETYGFGHGVTGTTVYRLMDGRGGAMMYGGWTSPALEASRAAIPENGMNYLFQEDGWVVEVPEISFYGGAPDASLRTPVVFANRTENPATFTYLSITASLVPVDVTFPPKDGYSPVDIDPTDVGELSDEAATLLRGSNITAVINKYAADVKERLLSLVDIETGWGRDRELDMNHYRIEDIGSDVYYHSDLLSKEAMEAIIAEKEAENE